MKLDRVVLNEAGVREVLKSPGVQADLRARAQRVASAAGPGHRVETSIGRKRARAAVITDTREARYAQATKYTLTRAVDRARG